MVAVIDGVMVMIVVVAVIGMILMMLVRGSNRRWRPTRKKALFSGKAARVPGKQQEQA